MAVIYKRLVKGSALSLEEYDANVENLNVEVEAATAAIATINGSSISSYTWNTRPVYGATTPGSIINVSDVGGEGGSLWRATSVGWVPLNGTVKLAGKWGTVASPVATLTGTTGDVFSISGGVGSLVIPATMLIPGYAALRIRTVFHRRGTNGTATARIYLGTAGTDADARAFFLSFAATNLLQIRPEVEVAAVTSASMTSTSWMPPGSTGSTNVVSELTTNINTDAAMTISFGIASANVADFFDLIGYSVVLEAI